MPKEVFRNQFEKLQDPNETHHPTPELSVSWGPTTGPDVQVGITLAPYPARAHYYAQLTTDTRTSGLDAETIEAVLDVITGPESGALGWYTHLDRYDTNRLIRTLRTARDKAFGRDE